MELAKRRVAKHIEDKNKSYELSALIDVDSFFYALIDRHQLILSDKSGQGDFTIDALVGIISSPVVKAKIAVLSDHFTMIPAADYQDSQCLALLQHACDVDLGSGNYVVQSDYHDEMGVFVCYAIPSGLYSRYSELCKETSFYHAVSALIQEVKYRSKDRILIHLSKIGDRTVVIISKNYQLLLVNTLHDSHALPILYYVSLMRETLALSDDSELELSGGFITSDGVFSLLSRYFAAISYSNIPLTLDGEELPSSSVFFPLYSISQCA